MHTEKRVQVIGLPLVGPLRRDSYQYAFFEMNRGLYHTSKTEQNVQKTHLQARRNLIVGRVTFSSPVAGCLETSQKASAASQWVSAEKYARDCKIQVMLTAEHPSQEIALHYAFEWKEGFPQDTPRTASA